VLIGGIKRRKAVVYKEPSCRKRNRIFSVASEGTNKKKRTRSFKEDLFF
jgi:hypothetical protein